MRHFGSSFARASAPTALVGRGCLLFLLTVILLLGSSSNSLAEWRIDFESKSVEAGATGVTMDITAYWDINMANFTVPVVIREIDPGSFWMGTLPTDIDGTPAGHPNAIGVTWNWSSPWAWLIEELRPAVPSDPCPTNTDVGYDGVTPDHFSISAAGAGTSTPPEPTGRVVLTLTFDVNSIAGDFEFDTACVTGSLNTIYMTDAIFPPVEHGPSGTNEATFNKGIITILPNACPDVIGSYASASVSGVEGATLTNTHDGTYHDPEGDTRKFYLISGGGVVDEDTGEWTWNTGCGDGGLHTIVIAVADVNHPGGGDCSTLSFEADIAATPVGANCGGDVSVHFGQTAVTTINYTTSCEPVTFEVLSGGGEIDEDGNYSWATSCLDLGANIIEIEVTDVAERSETCTFTVNVLNQLPGCGIPDASFLYSLGYSIDLAGVVSDPDGDGVSFSNLQIVTAPPGKPSVLPTLTGSVVEWSPVIDDAGAYIFGVDVSDGCETVTCEWDVLVSSTGDKVEIGDVTIQAKTWRVELPIRITTESPMITISIPIQARSVSGNAFWATRVDTLPWQMIPTNAVSNTRQFVKQLDFDYTTPDHFFLWAKANEDPCLFTADSAAYIYLRFGINDNPGEFELDTAFQAPLRTLHFGYCDNINTVVPVFKKGTVTIDPCDCSMNGDWNCDGRINPIDAVYIVNYVYLQAPQGPCNPGHCFQNGDINCDGNINPADVVWLAGYIYRPGFPHPCDPCTETYYEEE